MAKMSKETKKKALIVSVFTVLAAMAMCGLKLLVKVSNFKKRTKSDTVFKSSVFDYTDKFFDKAHHSALFSSMEVDLNNAIPAGSIMNLDLYGEYSSIVVKVPILWNVYVDGIRVRSGFDNHTQFDPNDEKSQRLNIKYDLKYSSLVVKYAKHEHHLSE